MRSQQVDLKKEKISNSLFAVLTSLCKEQMRLYGREDKYSFVKRDRGTLDMEYTERLIRMLNFYMYSPCQESS